MRKLVKFHMKNRRLPLHMVFSVSFYIIKYQSLFLTCITPVLHVGGRGRAGETVSIYGDDWKERRNGDQRPTAAVGNGLRSER